MIPKRLEEIVEADLDELVQNAVAEGTSLEYKIELPGNSDDDKKEFLADVSSLANTSGGDLIYGLEERDGIAETVRGVEVENPDVTIGRLDSIIRSGIDPRIRFSVHPTPLADRKTVIIIRIEQSWIGPHRVVFRGWDKFFGRHSNGKYPLDVSGLRGAFTLSSAVAEKIQNFRRERIAELAVDITPIPFVEGSKLVLHLVPFESFGSTREFAVLSLRHSPQRLGPLTTAGGSSNRINLEGLIVFSILDQGSTVSYVQFYRNGILEVVDFLARTVRNGETFISSSYERRVLGFLQGKLPVLQELGIQPPIFVFMTLIGVKGASMGINRSRYPVLETTPINREILFLGEATLEGFEQDPASIMKPVFDQVWNASGVEQSHNYGEDGNFLSEPA